MQQTKINWKWITGLSERDKTLSEENLLEENVRENLCEHGFDKYFVVTHQKHYLLKMIN
jgi:hypothetical protein